MKTRGFRWLSVLFPIGLLLIMNLPARAQAIRGFGVKIGPTSSDIRTDAGFENDPLVEKRHRRTGLVAFVFVEWLDASPLSIVTEAGYAQRGYYTEHERRDARNDPAGTFRVTTRFDYVSSAALLKFRHTGTSLAPYALAGPRLDVFLGGNPDNDPIAEAYNSLAAGGVVGFGVETESLLPVSVFLEARYSFDLTNALPDVPRDAYNNAFDVLIGVRF
ncbi:outer membrane beta-barrel protein [Rhodocaloribacter sp.]